jgi:biopolymer transport protein TolR
MGMAAGGDRKAAKHDINVTPLVDVVLVMLIIFLVTTPIMIKQITLEVPRKLDDQEDPTKAAKQITVKVKADGTVVISDGNNEDTVPRTELTQKLRAILKARVTEKIVFVDFDDKLPYREVIEAMDSIKGVGAEKIALKMRDENQPVETGSAPE